MRRRSYVLYGSQRSNSGHSFSERLDKENLFYSQKLTSIFDHLIVKSDKRSQIDSKTSSPDKINSSNWGETTKIYKIKQEVVTFKQESLWHMNFENLWEEGDSWLKSKLKTVKQQKRHHGHSKWKQRCLLNKILLFSLSIPSKPSFLFSPKWIDSVFSRPKWILIPIFAPYSATETTILLISKARRVKNLVAWTETIVAATSSWSTLSSSCFR